MKCLPRSAKRKRKLRNGKPFYWSAGDPPSTDRGKRRHTNRDGIRKSHAEMIWQGKIFVK